MFKRKKNRTKIWPDVKMLVSIYGKIRWRKNVGIYENLRWRKNEWTKKCAMKVLDIRKNTQRKKWRDKKWLSENLRTKKCIRKMSDEKMHDEKASWNSPYMHTLVSLHGKRRSVLADVRGPVTSKQRSISWSQPYAVTIWSSSFEFSFFNIFLSC